VHYYKKNIGDYAKKAGRLTMLQHGSYTLLIDACYDREQFPTLEQALEWTWASTEAEVEAVKFVLSRFFKLSTDGLYVQDRVLEELQNYHANAETNKRIAIEREAKRKGKSTNRAPFVHEPPPNQEPLTKEPVVGKPTKGSRLSPDWMLSKEWETWAQAERPDLNIHKTAESFRDFWIAKAGAGGVKLDWQATWRNWVRSQKGSTVAATPIAIHHSVEKTKQYIDDVFANSAAPSPEIRAKMAALSKAAKEVNVQKKA